ncbi:MAG: phosphatase PAP2 family protein [Bacteroidota bacterium]
MNNSILKYFLSLLIILSCHSLKGQFHSASGFLNFSDLKDSSTIINSFDEKIQVSFQKCRSKPVDFISKYFISPWGNGLYSLPALGTLYLYGNSNNDKKSKDAAIHGFETFLFTAITTSIFKLSFHRHRPCETEPPNSRIWDGPSFKRKYVSFPSGHTSSIFSIATLLASEYKGKPTVAVISYSIAGLAALSRIYENKHWFTDVLAGAVLGFACGKLIYQLNK